MAGGGLSNHVLVVDDDPWIRDTLREVLAEAGYAVQVASSAAEAFAALAAPPAPSVILVDLRMPEVDGLTLAHRLRAAGVMAPLVLMSADREAAAAGDPAVTAWFRKPIALPALIDLIAGFCSGSLTSP